MRARSLLFTVYGDSIRPHGGEIGIGSLIRLMAPLGFSPRAVRAAVSRTAHQGWLRTRRVGRRAFYSLTPQGAWRVAEGVRRVYQSGPEPWDARWRLLTYAIPEGRRPARDRLRRELTWLGLGPLSKSTWITPRNLTSLLTELAAARGVTDHVTIFEADSLGLPQDRALVARCWDLAAIAGKYRAFIRATRRRSAGRRPRLRRRGISPAACFAEKILLVHEYRKFLFVDPGLPAELLPPDWPGRDASRVFQEVYRMLAEPAARFFDAAFEPPPSTARDRTRSPQDPPPRRGAGAALATG
ncbi:MAG TPA: PaaX family transcriptional regulator C-terminal domain-containing protein [bacterium]|nr:PaaX family transcriptional regulator C-terminal domain-containing protein [bacterium]